jgi:hypothetical protein
MITISEDNFLGKIDVIIEKMRFGDIQPPLLKSLKSLLIKKLKIK